MFEMQTLMYVFIPYCLEQQVISIKTSSFPVSSNGSRCKIPTVIYFFHCFGKLQPKRRESNFTQGTP